MVRINIGYDGVMFYLIGDDGKVVNQKEIKNSEFSSGSDINLFDDYYVTKNRCVYILSGSDKLAVDCQYCIPFELFLNSNEKVGK